MKTAGKHKSTKTKQLYKSKFDFYHHRIQFDVQVYTNDVEFPFVVHLLMLFLVQFERLIDDDFQGFVVNTFGNDRETKMKP